LLLKTIKKEKEKEKEVEIEFVEEGNSKFDKKKEKEIEIGYQNLEINERFEIFKRQFLKQKAKL